ncbi:hypothetical protein B0A52_06865 [Exophiala mesophila]|uniref:Flavohemoprotein n=1 Tax=Exophiala mesophila TaxID=212818 RepID=A0A438N0Q6_EXOME|nr:hypothetical protein B0A52_06865 [Exophiala mesophila]
MATVSVSSNPPAPSQNASFHSSSPRPALSPEHTAIIKATVPVLAEHGAAVTTHFYKRMLERNPELRNIFNNAHQSTGTQPAALANAVFAYAANIDNLGALTAAVSRIGHKHASLGVLPEHYPIVGENLLASLKEVLGDAITQPIIDAWAAAYAQLADIFISFEANLYEQAEATPGGWTGWRKFKVVKKVPESDEITSFYMEPVDRGSLPPFKPGQFTSVRVFVPELNVYQPRQYSLSHSPNGQYFRISVKRESAQGHDHPAGRISNALHAQTPQGAEIELAYPYGDFTLDVDASTPVVLISAGVGLTPMLSMLDTLVSQSATSRQVLFLHATRSGRVHAMKDYLAKVVEQQPQVSKLVYYQNVEEGDRQGQDYDLKGYMDMAAIKDKVLLPDADYYLCGPLPFMQIQQKSLENLGVSPDRIHSEVFGSTTS